MKWLRHLPDGRRFSGVLFFIATAFLLFQTSCDQGDQSVSSNTNSAVKITAPVHIVTTNATNTEFQRLAFWTDILRRHPDLPDRLQQIVENRVAPVQRPLVEVPLTEITIHSYLGPTTVVAESINLIVTDLDITALQKLSAYLNTIRERVRELQPLFRTAQSNVPKVIVLGRNGQIDIKGVSGVDHQVIDIYNEVPIGYSSIKVHTFGEKGDEANQAILDYFRRANQSRGPPDTPFHAEGIERPPESLATVLVIGKLSTLNVGGATQNSTQAISFENYMNGFAKTERSQKASENVKIAETGAFFAEPPRPIVIEKPSGHSSSYSSRPSEPYRPPGGGGYRPPSRPIPRPGR
jgi:hypothetical protein